ncbi:MAG: leucine-rich repeat domain-containing protein [Muribaculaceae bacterium]|nr:leucine-rich repeat domain-containing protein [Muribaculaceae bacterium]
MKKIHNILVLIALLASHAIHLLAQDIEANGIFYNIISDTQVAVAPAYYDGANHYQGCIILPERVYCDGINYDVAAIAPRAFWRSAVTEVQIPNSVTMIGEAAFADAEQLANITLPLGLAAVSRYMLAGTALTHVVIPEGVTDIGTGAFEDCTGLRTVFLPASLRRIGDRAFGYCSSLNEVYSDAAMPPLTMGDAAFEGCEGIDVMLADEGTSRRYQDDGVWGDEEVFSLWIDEGLAVLPRMQQETVGGSWTVLTLGNSLAYKIYGPDGYLLAITAADRYFLPIGAQSSDYLVVPTTLMYDEEDLQMVATTAQPAAIEEIEEPRPEGDINIVGLDGTIYIEGDTHGMWTFIYDVYGNLWYERPAVNNWISLPGPRVYIVKVGNKVRKVFLN